MPEFVAPKHNGRSSRSGISSTELARLAGCNQSTVSRALAGDCRIGKAMRERIQELARAHGYRSNRLARSLLRGNDGTLAFVVPDCNNPVYFALMRELDIRCGQAGLRVFLADSQDDSDREKRWIDYFLERRVAALLVVPVSDIEAGASHAHFRQLRDESWPFMILGPVEDPLLPFLCGCDREAGELLGRHLAAQGTDHVLFFGSHAQSSVTQARIAGLRNVLPVGSCIERRTAPVSPEDMKAVADVVGSRNSRTTAVIFEQVLAAVGTATRLQQQGIRVPHDTLIAVFDFVPNPALIVPTLTHIVMPWEEMIGYAVAELARQLAEPGYLPVSRRFPGKLVCGESTCRL